MPKPTKPMTEDEKTLAVRFLEARFEESRGLDKLWDGMMRKLIALTKAAPCE